MGKLIQCAGPLAKHPYCFGMTRTNVYSIEEVCYYIRNNIYMMQEEVFDQEFAVWLRRELNMEETADKLEVMRRDHNNLKDIVVTLCCSCDYFTEAQINELIQIMDETQEVPLRGRQKIKADHFFRLGRLEKARQEYQSILQSDDMLQATPEEYGEVYHCLGMVCSRMGAFRQAAMVFRQAYEQNQRAESLQGYLYSLNLGGYQEEYDRAILELDLTEEQALFFQSQYREETEQCHLSRKYAQVQYLRKLSAEGKREEYQTRVREKLCEWKKDYRQSMEIS